MELKLVNAVMLGRYLSRGNTVLCSWVFVCKQLLAIQPPSKPVQNNLYQLRYSFFSMLCAVFRNKAFLFLFLFLSMCFLLITYIFFPTILSICFLLTTYIFSPTILSMCFLLTTYIFFPTNLFICFLLTPRFGNSLFRSKLLI